MEKQDYTAAAQEHIDTLYKGISTVLFKPTKAAEDQFRPTVESALSYFVATNGVCKEDKGFAIQPWTKVRFETQRSLSKEAPQQRWEITFSPQQKVKKLKSNTLLDTCSTKTTA